MVPRYGDIGNITGLLNILCLVFSTECKSSCGRHRYFLMGLCMVIWVMIAIEINNTPLLKYDKMTLKLFYTKQL